MVFYFYRVEQDTLRNKNIRLLDGGSFDVLIIGNTLKEAAIFASLAARGLPVALVSPTDLMAVSGLAVPDTLGAASASGMKELRYMQEVATTKAKLARSNSSGFSNFKHILMANEKKTIQLMSDSFLRWGTSKFVSSKPKIIRRKSIASIEPALLSENVNTAIEGARLSFLDTEHHYGVNLITRSLTNASAACNYVTVEEATHKHGKPWEVKIKDELTQKQYLLSAKVVIENQDLRALEQNEQDIFEPLAVETKPVRSISLLFDQKILPVKNFVSHSTENKSLFVRPYKSMTMVTSSEILGPQLLEESESSKIKSVLAVVSKKFRCEEGLNEEMVLRSWSTTKPFLCRKAKNPALKDLKTEEKLDVEVQDKLVRYRGGEASAFIPFAQRVTKIVGQLGIEMKPARGTYFGEPLRSQRDYFFEIAAEVGLDKAPHSEMGERSLTEVIWNRHWSKAFKVVGLLEENPELIAPIHPECSVIWAELPVFRDNDMITSLEDFFERRTDLSRIVDRETLFEVVSAEQLKAALGITQKIEEPVASS